MVTYLHFKLIKIVSTNFFILIERAASGFGYFSDTAKKKDVLLLC